MRYIGPKFQKLGHYELHDLLKAMTEKAAALRLLATKLDPVRQHVVDLAGEVSAMANRVALDFQDDELRKI